MAIKPKMTMWT